MVNLSARRDLGDLLLEERLLTEGVLRAARRLAKRERLPLVVVLMEEEHISEQQLVELLHRRLRLMVIDPSRVEVDDDVLREIPYDLAEKHRVLPIVLAQKGEGTALRVAMADPLDREAIEELERTTGRIIEAVIAPTMALTMAIRYRYRGVIAGLFPTPNKSEPMTPSAGTPRPAVRGPEALVTQPILRLDEEASLELRLKALMLTLIEAGIISERAYSESLRKLIKDSADQAE